MPNLRSKPNTMHVLLRNNRTHLRFSLAFDTTIFMVVAPQKYFPRENLKFIFLSFGFMLNFKIVPSPRRGGPLGQSYQIICYAIYL